MSEFCPMCKTSGATVGNNLVFKKKLKVMLCPNCKLYFLNLPRNISFINNYYQNFYWNNYSKNKESSLIFEIKKVALNTIYSMLLPHGKLLIITPDSENKYTLHNNLYKNPHIYGYNRNNLKKNALGVGLDVRFCRRINPYLFEKNPFLMLRPFVSKKYKQYTELWCLAEKNE